MGVAFKKTAKGEVAILPRKEYEALVAKAAEADEDAGTARLIARAREDLAAGAPVLPLASVSRLADGENAVRVIREWRGRTQLWLSHRTGLGQGYISDIENGRRKGTAAALKGIAAALEIPLDLLID